MYLLVLQMTIGLTLHSARVLPLQAWSTAGSAMAASCLWGTTLDVGLLQCISCSQLPTVYLVT